MRLDRAKVMRMALLHDKHDEHASTLKQGLKTSLKFKVGQVIEKIAKLAFYLAQFQLTWRCHKFRTQPIYFTLELPLVYY